MDKRILTVILGNLAVFLDAMKEEEEHQPRSYIAWVFFAKKIKGGI